MTECGAVLCRDGLTECGAVLCRDGLTECGAVLCKDGLECHMACESAGGQTVQCGICVHCRQQAQTVQVAIREFLQLTKQQQSMCAANCALSDSCKAKLCLLNVIQRKLQDSGDNRSAVPQDE